MTSQPAGRTIGDVVASMRERLELMPSGQQARRDFLSTYVRTTEAVAAAAEAGTFEDPAWVERWDVAFADLYLTALDADLAGSPGVSRPWRLAFAVPQDLPALRNVLVGVNAHINYDQPQSLLAVISDEAFADPVLLARRRRDHGRIDGILSARVSARTPTWPPAPPGRPWTACSRPSTGSPPAASCGRPARRSGTTRPSCIGPGWRGRWRMPRGWPNSNCSAPLGWPTCWPPARCCSGSPWAASGSAYRHQPDVSRVSHPSHLCSAGRPADVEPGVAGEVREPRMTAPWLAPMDVPAR